MVLRARFRTIRSHKEGIILKSWINALSNYSYPVNLSSYENSGQFPGHFLRDIAGDRGSTIEFEDYFRENARSSIDVYFEVIFWKLYTRKQIRYKITTRIVNYLQRENINPESLHNAIECFVEEPTQRNLRNIRKLLGIRTNVLAVALTFPAFLNPEKYPMIDNNVAKWVNPNLTLHNRNRQARLTPFAFGYPSLSDNDFGNYLSWVEWCNEMAEVLTSETDLQWRARDVEMAVFTAKRENLGLTPI